MISRFKRLLKFGAENVYRSYISHEICYCITVSELIESSGFAFTLAVFYGNLMIGNTPSNGSRIDCLAHISNNSQDTYRLAVINFASPPSYMIGHFVLLEQ